MRKGFRLLLLLAWSALLAAPVPAAQRTYHWLCLGRNGVIGNCVTFGSCCVNTLHERDENERATFDMQLKDNPNAMRLKTGEKRFYDPVTGFYYKAN
jgi:hypothetical protein